jgi:hypothetical protein
MRSWPPSPEVQRRLIGYAKKPYDRWAPHDRRSGRRGPQRVLDIAPYDVESSLPRRSSDPTRKTDYWRRSPSSPANLGPVAYVLSPKPWLFPDELIHQRSGGWIVEDLDLHLPGAEQVERVARIVGFALSDHDSRDPEQQHSTCAQEGASGIR